MSQLLRRRGVSLDRLDAFLRVFQAGGSIARAAPGEPVRQSQLSRQIAELEAALGATLFDRAGRSRVPTATAVALARVVHDIGRGLDDVVATAVAAPLSCTLGGGDSVLHWLVLPHAHEIEDVELELRALASVDVAKQLSDGRLDLGLLPAADVPPTLKAVRLGRIEYGIAARGQGVAALAAPVGEPALQAMVAKLGAVALRCETFPQVARAVRGGRFAGVLPRIAGAELGASVHWTPLPELGSVVLALAWRARLDDVRPRLRAVRRTLDRILRAALRAS